MSSKNPNEILRNFNLFFKESMNTLPKKFVKKGSCEKRWITPIIKALINDRWSAYRNRNFACYRQLKAKIRLMILEAKGNWSNKLINKAKNTWKVVQKCVNSKKSYDI